MHIPRRNPIEGESKSPLQQKPIEVTRTASGYEENSEKPWRTPHEHKQLHELNHELAGVFPEIKQDEYNRLWAKSPTPCGVMCPYLNRTQKVSIYRNQDGNRYFAIVQTVDNKHPLIHNKHPLAERYRYLKSYWNPTTYAGNYENPCGGSYGIHVQPLLYNWLTSKGLVAHEQHSICQGGSASICDYFEQGQLVGDQVNNRMVEVVHNPTHREYYWTSGSFQSASFYVDSMSSYTRCNRYEYIHGSDEPIDTHQHTITMRNSTIGWFKEEI